MTENERVYAIRKAKTLTMEESGAAIGIMSSAVSQIEKGKIGMTDQTLPIWRIQFPHLLILLHTADLIPRTDRQIQ